MTCKVQEQLKTQIKRFVNIFVSYRRTAINTIYKIYSVPKRSIALFGCEICSAMQRDMEYLEAFEKDGIHRLDRKIIKNTVETGW